jgi:threonyl-tRNA synthetase
VAIRVDGSVRDLMFPIRTDASIAILTERDRESLDVLRHSAAHIMATAVREIFPTAGIGFGPRSTKVSTTTSRCRAPSRPEDLEQIEARMAEVTKADYPFVRDEVDRPTANRKFADDPLKLERISELGDDEVISTYTDGPVHRSLPGPARAQHRATQALQAAHTAGLTGGAIRVARCCSASMAPRSSRRTSSRPTSTGWRRRASATTGAWEGTRPVHVPPVRAWRALLDRPGHDAVQPAQRLHAGAAAERVPGDQDPAALQQGLWEISGHWGKYKENMFLVLDNETGEHDSSLKPMNCPSHYLMYRANKHSYRELPIRYTTYDVLHRNEVSGALSGLTRVRQFQQDDCHIFLMPSQIADEVKRLTGSSCPTTRCSA